MDSSFCFNKGGYFRYAVVLGVERHLLLLSACPRDGGRKIYIGQLLPYLPQLMLSASAAQRPMAQLCRDLEAIRQLKMI